jgi:hypothetical protein
VLRSGHQRSENQRIPIWTPGGSGRAIGYVLVRERSGTSMHVERGELGEVRGKAEDVACGDEFS